MRKRKFSALYKLLVLGSGTKSWLGLCSGDTVWRPQKERKEGEKGEKDGKSEKKSKREKEKKKDSEVKIRKSQKSEQKSSKFLLLLPWVDGRLQALGKEGLPNSKTCAVMLSGQDTNVEKSCRGRCNVPECGMGEDGWCCRCKRLSVGSIPIDRRSWLRCTAVAQPSASSGGRMVSPTEMAGTMKYANTKVVSLEISCY